MFYCLKKTRFFAQASWTLPVFAFILNVPFAVGAESRQTGVDSRQGESKTAGMTVRIKLKDAKKFSQLSRLNRELASSRRKTLKLSSDSGLLERERELLRKELFEILENYRKQNASYRRLQLSVAATLASGELQAAGKREDQLVKALSDISDNGQRLALKTIEFCSRVNSVLEKMPLGAVRKTELALRMDDLKSEARKFAALADHDQNSHRVERCRILAIEHDLQIVVLPVGSVHGAFNGLQYYTGKGNQARLMIISVRPFVSAAVLTKGNINDLAPAMEAVTDIKMLKKQ